MENLTKAVRDVIGLQLNTDHVRKCFYNVYSFLLYEDTPSLLEALDYRSTLGIADKSHEKYFVFRYMLTLLQERHPRRLQKLFSL